MGVRVHEWARLDRRSMIGDRLTEDVKSERIERIAPVDVLDGERCFPPNGKSEMRVTYGTMRGQTLQEPPGAVSQKVEFRASEVNLI